MATPYELIGDIKSFIQAHGDDYGEWYVGVSPIPHATLFETHKVTKNSNTWIYLIADTADAAIEMATHFHNVYGTQGYIENIPEQAIAVYAFKLTESTSPHLTP